MYPTAKYNEVEMFKTLGICFSFWKQMLILEVYIWTHHSGVQWVKYWRSNGNKFNFITKTGIRTFQKAPSNAKHYHSLLRLKTQKISIIQNFQSWKLLACQSLMRTEKQEQK